MKFKAEIEFQMKDADVEDTDDKELADMLGGMLERGVDVLREEDEPAPIIYSIVVKGDIGSYTLRKDRR